VSRIDLHVHTSASDGLLSPAELVQKAAVEGLRVLAISDHDTVDGIIPALEAAKTFPHLIVIPSVEISTDVDGGEVHILGYYIDYTSDDLQSKLKTMRNSRFTRARKMVARLTDLGYHLDWKHVQEIAGEGSIGRPHIAQAMLEKGYIQSYREAFTKYIGRDGSAYVKRSKMTPEEAVELIVNSNGIPVLAHPFTAGAIEELVVNLKNAGLIGIETYYWGYTQSQINSLSCLAANYNLIKTGGSDYHGIDDDTGVILGGVEIPSHCVKQLILVAHQSGVKLASIHNREFA